MVDCGTLWGNMLICTGRGVRKVVQDELVLVASWEVKIAGRLVQMQIEKKERK
jgi:hypothetical protein